MKHETEETNSHPKPAGAEFLLWIRGVLEGVTAAAAATAATAAKPVCLYMCVFVSDREFVRDV